MKYEIELIPNYGNINIIMAEVDKLNISRSNKTRSAGFHGCDVPVILDIECSKEKAIQLKNILKNIASDTFGIYEVCSECGHRRII